MNQPVIHHLQSHFLTGRQARRFVHNPHSTAVDALNDLVAVDVLAGQAVVGGVSQPLGHDFRQEQTQVGNSIGQLVEIGRRQMQRLNVRLRDDICRSRLVGDQADFTDDIARSERSDRGLIGWHVAYTGERASFQDEQQILGGVSLAEQVSAWFELAKAHHCQQVGEGAVGEHRKRGVEQDAARRVLGGGRAVQLLLGVRRVQLVPQVAKSGEQVSRAGRRLPDECIDLASTLRVSRAGIVEERGSIVGVARQRVATEA